MISHIQGTIASIEEDFLVVDVNGIGYLAFASSQTLSSLPPVGDSVFLYTNLQVREESLTLFAFLSKEERNFFEKLITVNGVGPKNAISLLSCLDVTSLKLAILSGDEKSIAKANGIGKKTAERLILELKDKIDSDEILSSLGEASSNTENAQLNEAKNEALQALMSLGYSMQEASKALRDLPGDITDTEALLKEALKKMF